ncbi:glycoside hydrolase family 3 C-terminal domain-containing protein [Streptomyces sp. NBC_00638]|uniref:beta-glucosidase n=1 Tax=Streptomyces sp. NBC_00638 TaxID=2975794 RepID=UPI0022533457|nr:glycoside hydrolase family 3 C-terminal domain-containing protein [Streptomyces sp. NBC_00638]MCX5001580.1 glycoside hydrolase family 3 C-terminal domain-containing protein [Streptomyces sp. NBC_00638]
MTETTDAEAERERLLGKLTLPEKVRLLTGATTWRTRAEPALGLREMVLSDGPAGVRGQSWDERDRSLLLPSASALGALWDEELVERLGGLLAAEARRKGVDVVLAPTLNLHRTPLGGRHFECFSEDPELTGRTGAALVRGIQAHGVAATAKHYVANDSETDRLTVDVRVSERVLREVYLAPFEAAVQAGVRVVMAGYNGVNGSTMTASPLLTDPLKREWGFDGVVVSDWGALRTGDPAARAGLDLAMPGPESAWGEALVRAVETGRVPRSAVDDKVRRLLTLADACGALGGPPPAPGAVPRPGPGLLPAPGAVPGPGPRLTSAPESSSQREPGPGFVPGTSSSPERDPAPAPSWPREAVPGSGPEAVLSRGPESPSGPGAPSQPELELLSAPAPSWPREPVPGSGPESSSQREPVSGFAPGASSSPERDPAPAPGAGPETVLSHQPESPSGPEMTSPPEPEVPSAPEHPTAAAPVAGRPGALALLRTAVAASAVLLHNRGVLPLDPERLRTLAVIGAHAVLPRTQGGGSAGVFPERVVTPLDGIRAALGDGVRVVHAAGPSNDAPPPPLTPDLCTDPVTGDPGVRLRLLDVAGRELHSEHRTGGRQLEPPLVPGAHTVEIGALLLPGISGRWTLGIGGFGRMSIAVDEHGVLAGEFAKETDDPAVVHVNPPVHRVPVSLTAGRPVRVVARRELAPGTGRATVVTAAPPRPDAAAALADATRAAREADAAIVVVGTTEHGESEGYDRTDLGLGGHQDALVRAVTEANPRTVVVVNSGGPVELPWRARAGAVLLTWFPGQEGGAGLADVLFGRAEPGGRLPTTWAAALADAPVTRTGPTGGRLDYGEGLHIGYRAWARHHREPAYWFGHGLGYTTWSYDGLSVPDAIVAGEPFTVRVEVRNTGPRPGREVVQVYLAGPPGPLERPERWLAGYTAVRAEAGERTTAVVRIPARALRHWSQDEHAWRTQPGPYRVLAGRSAGALPLTATVLVRASD